VQDIPAIARIAHAHDAKVMMDNSWATPIFFAPFAHGVDVSIQAATKYIVGHSDAMMGTITATAEAFPAIEASAREFGATPGPDDCYLALRGVRTLAVRLARHQATGLALARWLASRPEVKRVLHPALPDDPGHTLWKRDFTGACGLFGIVLDERYDKSAVTALLNGMRHFGMGASWGGFESLILPTEPGKLRTARPWTEPGATIRLHAGLEDPADLIEDLEQGFFRLNDAHQRMSC
jgi:cystathionine beta-lyase